MIFRALTVSLLALSTAGCGGGDKEAALTPEENPASTGTEDQTVTNGMSAPSLADVIGDAEFRGEAAARDQYRHPAKTLEFFGLTSDMTVVEVWPGGGWYADILIPYISAGGGVYIAAHNDPSSSERAAERVAEFSEKYSVTADGPVRLTALSASTEGIAQAGSADMVLTFRNAHNWVMGGMADKAFTDFYNALKPGGVLGVVDHRLPEGASDEMQQSSGYLKESTVIALAEAAGFVLDAKSEVNANPADSADHPFGVWTLPPVSRTANRDGVAPEGFDPAFYLAIGESDRMTLRFVKPAE